MTFRYTDPNGDTAEQAVTWEIWQGYQGRWSRCKTFDNESEARAWLSRRHASCPHENLRLVSVETTTVRTVVESVAGIRDTARQAASRG